MPFAAAVRDYLNALLEYREVRQIGEAFLSVARDFGYRDGIVIDVGMLPKGFPRAVLATTHDMKELGAHNRSRSPFAAHATLAHARLTDRPFAADEVRARLSMSLSAWRETMPDQTGEITTVVFPVHRDRTLELFFGCSGGRPETSPSSLAMMHSCAHAAGARLRTLRSTEQDGPLLTRREAECLRLASLGKTDAEISIVVGIAPRTVRFHLANVKSKLGATSRINAIAKRTARQD